MAMELSKPALHILGTITHFTFPAIEPTNPGGACSVDYMAL